MAEIKINKFNGIVTNYDENDLSLETIRDSKNYKFYKGLAEEYYPKLAFEQLPDLKAGYTWETGIITQLTSDKLQEDITVSIHKIIFLVAVNNDNGTYSRQMWYSEFDPNNEIGKWYSVTTDYLPFESLMQITSDFFVTTLQGKTKLINDNGVLKVYLPHDSFWFGLINRKFNLPGQPAQTLDGWYFDRLSEPLTGTSITSPNNFARLGVSVTASQEIRTAGMTITANSSVIVDSAVRYVPGTYGFPDSIDPINGTRMNVVFRNQEIADSYVPNDWSKIYNLGPNSEDQVTFGSGFTFTFFREQGFSGTTNNWLIPKEVIDAAHLTIPIGAKVVSSAQIFIPSILFSGLTIQINQDLVVIPDNLIDNSIWVAADTIESDITKDPDIFKEGDHAKSTFITTMVLDDTTELISNITGLKLGVTSNTYYVFKYSLTIPKNINKRVTKIRVYQKFNDDTDFQLVAQINITANNTSTDFYITKQSYKGIYLTQAIGFALLQTGANVDFLANYKVITGFKDIAFEKGYSIAIVNNKCYYCTVGNGRVMTDLFYETNLIPLTNDNVLNGCFALNGKFGVSNVDTTFVIAMIPVDGNPTFDVQDSLEYGIKSKEDYALIKGGVLLHTTEGIFSTDGYNKEQTSEQIVNIIRDNYATGKIKYNPHTHEIFYWNGIDLVYYLFSYVRKVWERYDLEIKNLYDILFDQQDILFLGASDPKEVTTTKYVVDPTTVPSGVMTGTGIATDPYILSTPAHMMAIPSLGLDKYYKLNNSIDMSNENWIPLGDETTAFTGSFDGNYKTIYNLTQTASNIRYNGMFGLLNGLVIKNFILESPVFDFTSTSFYCDVGSLAGSGSGTVTLVKVNNPKINIIHTAYGVPHIGGFFGYSGGTTATYCSVDNLNIVVSILQQGMIGGFAGWKSGADISECYATGTIHASRQGSMNSLYLGGFAGLIGLGNNVNNFARVDINIGTADYTSAINGFGYSLDTYGVTTNNYSAGNLQNITLGNLNGFSISNSNSTPNLNYFDSTLANTTQDCSQGGIGTPANPEITSLMKLQSTFTGFDFTTIWHIDPKINDGYPYLINCIIEKVPLLIPGSIAVTTTQMMPGGFYLYRSDGIDLINGNYFETIESGLEAANMIKWINNMYIDFIGKATLIVTCDGRDTLFILDHNTRDLEKIQWPMIYRNPFKKLKMKCISDNGFTMYNIMFDIEAVPFEDSIIYAK